MPSLDIISKRLKYLSDIPLKNDVIHLHHIRKEFRKDLQHFIVGETLSIVNGHPVIGKNLYNGWLSKLKAKGFDYDIHFR